MAFEEEVTGSTKLSPPGNSQPTGKNDILMYALIGAGAGVLLIMPTVFLLARHQHRKRVIRTLKAMAAATGSQAVLVGNNTLIAAPGMAGLPGMNTVGIRSAKGKRANVYDAGPGVSESQTGLTQLPNAVTMSTGSLGGSQTVLARARTGTNASNLSGTSNTKFRRRSRTTLRDSTTPDLQALPTEKLSRKQ